MDLLLNDGVFGFLFMHIAFLFVYVKLTFLKLFGKVNTFLGNLESS